MQHGVMAPYARPLDVINICDQGKGRAASGPQSPLFSKPVWCILVDDNPLLLMGICNDAIAKCVHHVGIPPPFLQPQPNFSQSPETLRVICNIAQYRHKELAAVRGHNNDDSTHATPFSSSSPTRVVRSSCGRNAPIYTAVVVPDEDVAPTCEAIQRQGCTPYTEDPHHRMAFVSPSLGTPTAPIIEVIPLVEGGAPWRPLRDYNLVAYIGRRPVLPQQDVVSSPNYTNAPLDSIDSEGFNMAFALEYGNSTTHHTDSTLKSTTVGLLAVVRNTSVEESVSFGALMKSCVCVVVDLWRGCTVGGLNRLLVAHSGDTPQRQVHLCGFAAPLNVSPRAHIQPHTDLEATSAAFIKSAGLLEPAFRMILRGCTEGDEFTIAQPHPSSPTADLDTSDTHTYARLRYNFRPLALTDSLLASSTTRSGAASRVQSRRGASSPNPVAPPQRVQETQYVTSISLQSPTTTDASEGSSLASERVQQLQALADAKYGGSYGAAVRAKYLATKKSQRQRAHERVRRLIGDEDVTSSSSEISGYTDTGSYDSSYDSSDSQYSYTPTTSSSTTPPRQPPALRRANTSTQRSQYSDKATGGGRSSSIASNPDGLNAPEPETATWLSETQRRRKSAISTVSEYVPTERVSRASLMNAPSSTIDRTMSATSNAHVHHVPSYSRQSLLDDHLKDMAELRVRDDHPVSVVGSVLGTADDGASSASHVARLTPTSTVRRASHTPLSLEGPLLSPFKLSIVSDPAPLVNGDDELVQGEELYITPRRRSDEVSAGHSPHRTARDDSTDIPTLEELVMEVDRHLRRNGGLRRSTPRGSPDQPRVLSSQQWPPTNSETPAHAFAVPMHYTALEPSAETTSKMAPVAALLNEHSRFVESEERQRPPVATELKPQMEMESRPWSVASGVPLRTAESPVPSSPDLAPGIVEDEDLKAACQAGEEVADLPILEAPPESRSYLQEEQLSLPVTRTPSYVKVVRFSDSPPPSYFADELRHVRRVHSNNPARVVDEEEVTIPMQEEDSNRVYATLLGINAPEVIELRHVPDDAPRIAPDDDEPVSLLHAVAETAVFISEEMQKEETSRTYARLLERGAQEVTELLHVINETSSRLDDGDEEIVMEAAHEGEAIVALEHHIEDLPRLYATLLHAGAAEACELLHVVEEHVRRLDDDEEAQLVAQVEDLVRRAGQDEEIPLARDDLRDVATSQIPIAKIDPAEETIRATMMDEEVEVDVEVRVTFAEEYTHFRRHSVTETEVASSRRLDLHEEAIPLSPQPDSTLVQSPPTAPSTRRLFKLLPGTKPINLSPQVERVDPQYQQAHATQPPPHKGLAIQGISSHGFSLEKLGEEGMQGEQYFRSETPVGMRRSTSPNSPSTQQLVAQPSTPPSQIQQRPPINHRRTTPVDSRLVAATPSQLTMHTPRTHAQSTLQTTPSARATITADAPSLLHDRVYGTSKKLFVFDNDSPRKPATTIMLRNAHTLQSFRSHLSSRMGVMNLGELYRVDGGRVVDPHELADGEPIIMCRRGGGRFSPYSLPEQLQRTVQKE